VHENLQEGKGNNPPLQRYRLIFFKHTILGAPNPLTKNFRRKHGGKDEVKGDI
jgi:hypothetical protein